MRKKYVEMWIAVDGTEFTTQEECDKYEKEKGFRHKYNVEIHYSGTFYTTVEAVTENEALHKAREKMGENELDWDEDENYVDLAD